MAIILCGNNLELDPTTQKKTKALTLAQLQQKEKSMS
jgi:hypothetical protein